MKIVIDIDEEDYKRIQDIPAVFDSLTSRAYSAIRNGTPQPKVIRCNDCKHWTNNIGDSKLRDNYCNEEAHGFFYQCSGDDYCSFAESEDKDADSD